MGTKQNSGCGCLKIPLSVVILMVSGSYWWLIYLGNIAKVTKFLPPIQLPSPIANLFPSKSTNSQPNPLPIPTPSSQPIAAQQPVAVDPAPPKIDAKPQLPLPIAASPPPTNIQNSWQKKAIRGIYLSRYQVTNNADEQTIRQRIRYYRSQGINTIIHGVWGNGCTMYNSEVMQQMLGAKSCPNQFQDRWLE